MTRLHVTPFLLVLFAAAAVHAQTSAQATSEPAATRATGTLEPTPAALLGDLPATEQPAPSPVSFVGLSTGGRGPTEAVLVVPGKALDAQTLDRIVEDLTIMGRIIEKGLSPQFTGVATNDVMTIETIRMVRADGTGPDVLSPPAGRARPMYVGGYGAVFFLEVDFALLPPPEAPVPPAKPEKEDPVWAEAKRSLESPEVGSFNPYPQAPPAPQPYDAETVTALKARLIAGMKHAANIKVIAPDEWLAVVVQGPGPVPGAKTVLTLRARKADIDQFAADKLDRTEFEQRVQTISY